MPYYKFKENEILRNRIKTHPKKEFFIYDSEIFLDNQSQISGAFTGSVPGVPPGYVSLYELNVDRTPTYTGRNIPNVPGGIVDNSIITPFLTRNGSLLNFRTISTSEYLSLLPGEVFTGSYPMSASITRQLFTASLQRSSSATRINALKNTLNYYTPLSRRYAYSASWGDKGSDVVNLVSIPSIFYGSSIEKGTVDLKFYLTGTLIGELRDLNKNGNLVQVGPTGSNGSGSVAGVVLYNEGFLVLTGSWKLGQASLDYYDDGTPTTSSWIQYGVGANDGIPSDASSRISASYGLEFNGTNYVPVTTMFAHAPAAQLNYSNNPTYIDQNTDNAFLFMSGTLGYKENDKQIIKNTVSSSYVGPTGSYRPQTFISKIGIYDKDKNLIAIANVATPVKKTEERDLTFKLKLDF